MPTSDDLQPRSNELQPRSDGLQPNINCLQPQSHGVQLRSVGLQPTSNGLQPNSDGLQPRSNGLQPNSDGLQPRSDGLQPIRLDCEAEACDLLLLFYMGYRSTRMSSLLPLKAKHPFRDINTTATRYSNIVNLGLCSRVLLAPTFANTARLCNQTLRW